MIYVLLDGVEMQEAEKAKLRILRGIKLGEGNVLSDITKRSSFVKDKPSFESKF